MDRPTDVKKRPASRQVETLDLISSAFGHGQRIPEDYTVDGRNRSPELSWASVPDGTFSFALLCDDPDAPRDDPFVHWVMFDLPAGAMGLPLTSIPEGVSKDARPREVPGAMQGTNDFGKLGYDGPAPPRGHGTHHYHFKLFALDRLLDLQAGARKADVLRAMKGHILGQGELIGTYSRSV